MLCNLELEELYPYLTLHLILTQYRRANLINDPMVYVFFHDTAAGSDVGLR